MTASPYASDAKIAEALGVIGGGAVSANEQTLLQQILVGVSGNRTPAGEAPVNTSPPTVSGDLIEGGLLTVTPGVWTGSPTLTYQWQLSAAPPSWSDIVGETGLTYTIQSSDIGMYIRVLETATNAFGVAEEGSVPQLVPDLTPQNLQATVGDRQVNLTWDADANPGYTIFANWVNDFNTAIQVGTALVGATSKTITTDDGEPSEFVTTPSTGSKYWYWIVGGGAWIPAPVTDPSNEVTARSFVILPNTAAATLYVPDGATMTLGDLFFGATQPPPLSLLVDYMGGQYGSDGAGGWEDINTADPATNLPISGSFQITNNNASAYTFWNTEP